jgi:hypothetical protein
MPLEQLFKSCRGVLSSLGHTENWFRLLHRMARQGADFRISSLSSPVAPAALTRRRQQWRAALAEPARLSLIRELRNQKR